MIARAAFSVAIAAVALALAIAGRAERLVGGEPTLHYEVTLSSDAIGDASPDLIERIWKRRLHAYEVHVELGTPGPPRWSSRST